MDTKIELRLLRVASSDKGTFGVLSYQLIPFALTMELPWKDNHAQESCIPSGRYLCKRILSPHFGEVFEVTDVPHRARILIHKGNYLSNTLGCILVGEQFAGTYDAPYIAESQSAFTELMSLLKSTDVFTLSIEEYHGTV